MTTAAQHLLIGGTCAPLIKRLLGVKSIDTILAWLKAYKKDMSDENYMRLFNTIGVFI